MLQPRARCTAVTFKTEQENFWAGKFGTEYIRRNTGAALLASNLAFFSMRCAARDASATASSSAPTSA